MPRKLILATVGLAAAGALAGVLVSARLANARVFTTEKVCQLTGEWDKHFEKQTLNSHRGFGITGSDLGFPVPSGNDLYFLFGDTRPFDPDTFTKDDPGWDSIARGPLTRDIERDGCPPLEFETDAPFFFRPVRFAERGKLPRALGRFEVPISGYTIGSTFLVFFALRDHGSGCRPSDGCAPADEQPGGQTKLGMKTGNHFSEVTLVSTAKFLSPVPVVTQASKVPGLPPNVTGNVLLIWGSGKEDYKFRHSYPFLAVAPLERSGFIEEWRYFGGIGGDGKPMWREHEGDAKPLPPFGSIRYERDPRYGPGYHQCLGEFSAGYVAEWRKWMMLYACGGGADYNKNHLRGIQLRTADAPWGPWSEAQRIFNPDDGYCRFMHSKNTCPPGTTNPGDASWQEVDANGDPTGEQKWGGEYAPFLIPSYTAVSGDTTLLYWVMSTWNPYQSVLMRTRARPLRISDILETVQRSIANRVSSMR